VQSGPHRRSWPVQLCLQGVPAHPGTERLRAGDYPSLKLQQPVAFGRKKASHELSVAIPPPARYSQFNSVDNEHAIVDNSRHPSPAARHPEPGSQPIANFTR
jgi:hypothetical protein